MAVFLQLHCAQQGVSSITLKQKHPKHHRQESEEHSVAVSTISQP